MSVTCRKLYLTVSVVFYLILSACGGGGDGGGEAGVTSGGTSGLGAYAQPPRYAASSYSQFTSMKGTADLTGTWMMLISGVMTNGMTPSVTGRNYTESQQYFARAIVRINANPNLTNGYYIYSCGPGGARDTSTTYAPGATTITLPYFFFSTGNYVSYPINVVDANTLQNSNIVRDWDWYGSNGWAMSYTLSFTYKRVSDNPFAAVGSVTDLNAPETTEVGCVYESEGAYVATENDAYQQNLNKSGAFYIADSYPVSPVNEDLWSFSQIFHMRNFTGYAASYSRARVFNTQNGDTISPAVSVNGNDSSYTVHATSASDSSIVDDGRLDFAP